MRDAGDSTGFARHPRESRGCYALAFVFCTAHAMTQAAETNRLDRPVAPGIDHVLGPDRSEITLVEYGSYACPYCRAANEEIAKLRDRFGDRLRYVFRQRPLTGSDIARRAADIAESAADEAAFWRAHVALMTRSAALDEGDLDAVGRGLGLSRMRKARRRRWRAAARASTRTSRARARAASA